MRKMFFAIFILIVLFTSVITFAEENQTQPAQITRTQPATSTGGGSSGNLCPDGICDEAERANPNMCPQDCGGTSASSGGGSAQTCSGCLNNGVCDVGECAGCQDCM